MNLNMKLCEKFFFCLRYLSSIISENVLDFFFRFRSNSSISNFFASTTRSMICSTRFLRPVFQLSKFCGEKNKKTNTSMVWENEQKLMIANQSINSINECVNGTRWDGVERMKYTYIWAKHSFIWVEYLSQNYDPK